MGGGRVLAGRAGQATGEREGEGLQDNRGERSDEMSWRGVVGTAWRELDGGARKTLT